jgi:hypothetical protein
VTARSAAPENTEGVRVVVDGRAYRGPAVDLRDAPATPAAVLAGLRGEDRDARSVRVEAPAPGPVGRTLGAVDGERGIDRSVLAAVARSRGLRTSVDAEIERLEERLTAIDPPGVDRRAARRRLAEATADTERLREEVAERRGRLRARRDDDRPTAAAADDLAAATDRLVEAETERIAACQRLDRARSAARRTRDARERRLKLEDRIENRRRPARRRLAERILPAVAAALSTAPGGPGRTAAGPLPSDSVIGELAAYRCGRPATAVVVAAGPFANPRAASAWLDAPVLMV